MESLFTFLFKHRPVVFEDGRFAFAAAHPGWIVLGGLLVAALVAFFYRRRTAGTLLLALRLAAVAVVVLILLRPVLWVSTAVPGENFLAVLMDDSRSMRLKDRGSSSRGEEALAAFGAASELRRRLAERFTLRHYRFSAAAEPFEVSGELRFDGGVTDLKGALEQVRSDLAGIPLAGLVVVTDGADNGRPSAGTRATLGETLLQLKSRAVPVYTVGLGEERLRRDVELSRLDGPRRLLAGSAFAVDVAFTQRGYDGRSVRLTVEEDGAIVHSRDVDVPRGQTSVALRVNLAAGTEARTVGYTFGLDAGDDEPVRENNVRSLLVTVEERREKILYVEGEPRWEVKFLRQALAEDENVQVVVLQRTAPKKFVRLGVDGPLELLSGFPSTREELFAYRGLILGSVPADFFTDNQLRIIEEFVSQRGGGLLMLGGRRSFAEGGYAGTVLADVSPLFLAAPVEGRVTEVRVRRTAEGEAHAALQLTEPEGVEGSADESAESWSTLPPLTTRNVLRRAKPGASVLLRGTPDGTPVGDGDLVVLASQRYGRGRVVAFPVQDSWIWQMHADIPLGDLRHERLWRQLLRWLVSAVPEAVELTASGDRFAPGEAVELRAEVRDAAYLGLNGARVTATVVDPTGAEQSVPLAWTVERDGEYRGSFAAAAEGPYEVHVRAEHGGEEVGSDTVHLEVGDMSTEFFRAGMNAPLLRRIADATGGRFYTADDVPGLAEDVRYTASGKTVVEALDLWDMPAVFLLLLALVGTEWIVRRQRGLP